GSPTAGRPGVATRAGGDAGLPGRLEAKGRPGEGSHPMVPGEPGSRRKQGPVLVLPGHGVRGAGPDRARTQGVRACGNAGAGEPNLSRSVGGPPPGGGGAKVTMQPEVLLLYGDWVGP